MKSYIALAIVSLVAISGSAQADTILDHLAKSGSVITTHGILGR
jgi:hypothetical protein